MNEYELVERIRAVVPLLHENARQAELDRKPVDSVMAAIAETGAYKYFVPKRYGGYEFSLETFMDVGVMLGEGCISTAWVTTFCMEHNWLLSLFNQETQDEIFSNQPYIIAPGSLAPNGTATPTDGGYRLTGRWQWGTGVMHADWILVGALTPTDDPQKPDLCMFLLPRSDVEVIDTWQVAGMVGTGSNDIGINDVLVPGHRKLSLSKIRDGFSPGAIFHDTPTYKMPMMPVLGLTAAAPAVGGARQAVKLFQQWLTERTLYGTTDKQSQRAIAQARLGHAQVSIESAEYLLKDIARTVTEWGARGEPCPIRERARLRLRIAHVVRQARDVVRDVVEASGSHAQFLDNPLQRIQRDLQTLSCHTVFDMDVGGELYGRMLLGLPANAPV